MHVAIIMDGNGRWAQKRGLMRTLGHRAGASSVRRVIRAAAEHGIDVLTLYAFSSDNWTRPRSEVDSLMSLFKRTLVKECERCVESGVRVSIIGRRDRLDAELIGIIETVEHATSEGRRMHLRIAVDYSSRHAIASSIAQSQQCAEAFTSCSRPADHNSAFLDVDLLIRTGGERRLSDFLLWECAYAELVFVDTLWPDFEETHFEEAIEIFRQRERRFGGLPDVPAGRQCRDRKEPPRAYCEESRQA